MRFSVAIPVRNDAAWLAGAIESVLAQTYRDWELVIGDNASTDDLAAIVDRYQDPRLRYHRWPTTVGVARNHNRTVDLCRFEWVHVLSADDRLEPTCLELIAGRIRAEANCDRRLGLVVGRCKRVDGRGERGEMTRKPDAHGRAVPLQPIAGGKYGPEDWLNANARPGLRPWMMGGVSAARDVLIEAGAFRPELGLCVDLELVLRLAAYGDVLYIDQPLVRYTLRPDSVTSLLQDHHVTQSHGAHPFGEAWDSALLAHAERRRIGADEQRAINAAKARAHLQRALHRRRATAGPRAWFRAVRDVACAATLSPATVLGSWRGAVALAAILSPRTALAHATSLAHRLGVVLT